MSAERRTRVSGATIQAADRFAPYKSPMLGKVEAEKALIGAVLQEPLLYPLMSDIVQPGDFYLLTHGMVWYVMEQLTERGSAIDVTTVAEALDTEAKSPIRGEAARRLLIDLYSAPQDALHAEDYARIVRNEAMAIRLLVAADKMKEAAVSGLTPNALVDECNRLLFEATEQTTTRATTITSAAEEFAMQLEARHDGEVSNRPTPSGYIGLDTVMGGYHPGEVTILAGMPGDGKTTMLLSMLRNMALSNLSPVLFSLEMERTGELMPALLSQETGIPKRVLMNGRLSPSQMEAFTEAVERVKRWRAHLVEERGVFTTLMLRRKLRVLLTRQPVDCVMIDGLWLMKHHEAHRDRRDEVAAITRELTAIAKGELGAKVPIVLTHQYSREVRGAKKPTLEHLAESASVERNCQVVFGLWRTEAAIPGNPSVTELHVLKDRNGGKRGHVQQFAYDGSRSRYDEMGVGFSDIPF